MLKDDLDVQNNNCINSSQITFEFECYLDSNVEFVKSDFLDINLLYNFVNRYLSSGIKHPTF